MPSGEARYIKKKVKTRTVDVHPTENALIVNYEVEAIILGDDKQPMIGDQKKCQKIIRFHSLNTATNCSALAKDVIDKCKLIHPSKLDEVQHLLRYLQYRNQCASSILVKSSDTVDTSPLEENPTNKNEEKANLLDLEDYIELLYDEMPDKIKGSNLILQLCKDSSNLDELTKNESLLSVLSRVLREDWKKNLELSINLVSVFEKISEYTVFHHIILEQKIGSLCIEMITYELKKYEDLNNSTDFPKDEKVDKTKLFRVISKKLDQLFNVCFSLLLNISENEKIEDKIRKRGIVSLLVHSLNGKSIELLATVLRFLQKLSIYKENKDAMTSMNIIEKLPKILIMSTKENNNLIDYLLPLLFNLSFERKLCEQMIRVGFLPELMKMIQKCRLTKNQKYILGLLYHFTMDDRVKSMFAYTDSMNIIIEMLLHPELGDDPILKALCVNLALNSKNAEALCDYRVISTVMEKAFNNKDAIYMKIIRNIVSLSNVKDMFEIYASEVTKSLKLYIHTHKNFTCECIGFLANLSTTHVDYNTLFKKFQLFPLIKQCFIDLNFVTDDIRLEFLILLGTVAYDETMADSLFQSDILALLVKHIKDKQEDDEVVLQIIFVFYQVLQHPLTRDYVTKRTDAPLYFIDLLHDNNPNIRKICRACLDIIKDFDDTWTERIKMEKFQWHNSYWLEMIQSQILSSNNFDKAYGDDDALPHYNLLQQSMMFQSGSHLSLSADGSIEVISNIMNSEESSQSVSEYNSDADFDLEYAKQITPFDEKYDLHEGFNNLIIDDSSCIDLL